MNRIHLNRFCRALVLLAALLEFSASARALIFTDGGSRPIPRRASIIFIQVDGLGYGDLSCYGQTKFQTPNLDKLAAEGIRFTNYFVAGDAAQSHAALIFGNNSGGAVTVAQILKNSGYHTGYIGEWDLGDENSAAAPWKKGFDEFAGYFNRADAENFYANYIWSLPPDYSYDKASGTFIEWDPSRGQHIGGREMLYANTQGKDEYIPDLFAKMTQNFIKENLPDEFNHYRPFFLLLNYVIPDEKIEVPTDAPFSEEPWPQPEKNRAALISRIDGYVGQLREQLENSGMTNNVVIFFSSGSVPRKTAEIDPDFFRSNFSTNDFRVPMIVNWPGKIPAGQASGLKWSPADFLPTVTEIAFAQSPTNIDGTSVLPALLGPVEP